jgi:hypothetical protein
MEKKPIPPIIAAMGAANLGSLIDDIRADKTKILLREQDGKESDVTGLMIAFLDYAKKGLVLTATGKVDEENEKMRTE